MYEYQCSKCKMMYYSASTYDNLNDIKCGCGGNIFYTPESMPKGEQLKRDVARLERIVEADK